MAKEIKKTINPINQDEGASASKLIHTARSELRGEHKQMSYYLPADLIKAIAIKAAYDEVDKSQVVRDALTSFLEKELGDIKKR
jgi:hypothetical protein